MFQGSVGVFLDGEYPMIYSFFCILGGDRRISEPSTACMHVLFQLWLLCRLS